MTSQEIIKALEALPISEELKQAAIHKILEIDAKPDPAEKTYHIKMSVNSYKEFIRFKLFCDFIKQEL
ncbi:MAG: hypothetical protein ACOYO1_02395 [Bacteroidales bacterium]